MLTTPGIFAQMGLIPHNLWRLSRVTANGHGDEEQAGKKQPVQTLGEVSHKHITRLGKKAQPLRPVL